MTKKKVKQWRNWELENVSDIFSSIYRLVRKSPEVVIVTADNGFPNFNAYKSVFPDRFFNFGISETNMMLFSAGMSSCGRIPYTFAIATFLTMRAYEFIRNDICIPNRNVKMIGINAGLNCSKLGNSHYSIEDIAILSVLPNISILSPCCTAEMVQMLKLAKEIDGPVYIRYNNQITERFPLPQYDIFSKKAHELMSGKDISIFVSGDLIYEAYEAANLMKEKGINVSVVYFPVVKPIDNEKIIEIANKTNIIVTVEEHSVTGGFGSIVMDNINESGIKDIRLEKIGIEDFCLEDKYGSWDEIREKKGISANEIYRRINEIIS